MTGYKIFMRLYRYKEKLIKTLLYLLALIEEFLEIKKIISWVYWEEYYEFY